MTLETAENRRRELASAVKRLRVAAASDPQHAEELADALVELTAVQLLAWDVAEAAALAPEAVVLAARILASRGPSGPYASLPDAVRYFAASAQLAAVQAGLGQAEAAGRTLDGLDAWRHQVGRLPLAANLSDRVAVWALVARARALLPTDVAGANAHADAAEVRLHAIVSPEPYLALAVHLLVADTRWAAGRPDAALAHHRLALETHALAVTDDAGRRPAVARAAVAPVPAVYETYGQRLAALGDTQGRIALLRTEVALLESFPGTDAMSPARAGLALALTAAGRRAEAEELAPGGTGPESVVALPLDRVSWEPLAPASALAPDDPGWAADARARWRRAEQAAVVAGVAARAEAERGEAVLRAQAEAAAQRRADERAQAEWEAAERAAAARAEQDAARQREMELSAARAESDAAAARAAAEERRRALAREHQRSVDPDAARAAAAELELARQAVRDAADEPALAASLDRLAGVLRPLASVEPGRTAELAETLEALVGLRWRLGDPDGSRAAAREAKSLRR